MSLTLPTPAVAARLLDDDRLALADRIARRLADTGRADPSTRRAVARLVASADVREPGRHTPRPDDAPVLLERLAVWALARADDDAVHDARDELGPGPSRAPADRARLPITTTADRGRHVAA
jgi:hypothetical protein